jgi:nitric oxide reductase large subunit
MKATAKYFWVVTALFVSQVLLGVITAHYAVDGQGLYELLGNPTIQLIEPPCPLWT